MPDFHDEPEYTLIKHWYGDRKAERSKVRLMNHIDEGLIVLDAISASKAAKKAFCLHPLVQHDADLSKNYGMLASFNPYVVMLVMEYRSVANDFLSDKIPSARWDHIRLSPIQEVNDMLIADKVQNYKDFLLYHANTHSRAGELDEYFRKWLAALNVTGDFEILKNMVNK